MKSISVIAVEGICEVKAGMDLAQVIIRAAEADGITFKENDILVVAQKIVSKAEGRFVNLREVVPTPEAYRLAEKSGKPPALCQLIINESVSLIRVAPNVIIAETRCGCVCANAGIDRSNTGQKDDWVLLLPENPDQSAKRIAEGIKGYLGFDVAVIINDTQGRPFRRGAVGTAIGVFGINPLKSYVGLVDRYGRVLH
ncbi:MAG: coenzyme F420-0:L-glutamate ligase, partial [Clostridia bacterium]|nr:coenzyme F420-0:L-glutamate ligase [Clostridia bacterium]